MLYRIVTTFVTMLKAYLCTYYVAMFKIMTMYAKQILYLHTLKFYHSTKFVNSCFPYKPVQTVKYQLQLNYNH